MKTGLPPFLLLTDPYNSLEGRILILKTRPPRFIYELGRPELENAQRYEFDGQEYTVAVCKNLDNEEIIDLGSLHQAARWYHYSKPSQSDPSGESDELSQA